MTNIRIKDVRLLRMVFPLVLASLLAACEVEGSYVPTTAHKHETVQVESTNTYGDYAAVKFNVIASGKQVRIDCAGSRLTVSKEGALIQPELKPGYSFCMDDSRDLMEGEKLSIRFRLVPSVDEMYRSGADLVSREGQPKRIELLLKIQENGKWVTQTFPFKMHKDYRVVIPFSKG